MAVNKVRNIAPFINVKFKITSPWWTYRSEKLHRGLDIATSGKQPVYSMLTGVVHSKGTNSTAGNWIIIWDNDETSTTYGYATRYLHLDQLPLVVVGQAIQVGEYVGLEGTTGASTGVHLHVEMQDISRFDLKWYVSNTKSDYLNPCIFMGIDNKKGTWWLYDGTPKPTPPTPASTVYPHKFPWVLYARKFRNGKRQTNV